MLAMNEIMASARRRQVLFVFGFARQSSMTSHQSAKSLINKKQSTYNNNPTFLRHNMHFFNIEKILPWQLDLVSATKIFFPAGIVLMLLEHAFELRTYMFGARAFAFFRNVSNEAS
jgi:hypothetical protein